MNLDAIINEVSYSLAEKLNNKKKELENSLGVLASDGVYAFYVFCKRKKIWDIIEQQLGPLKKYISCLDSEGIDQKYFERISGNLQTLLFVKEVMEKTLNYARYHLKAMGEEK
ncbi:MAG: hypothetical protein ACP5FZ_12310 [Fidelibacterota bacterium]